MNQSIFGLILIVIIMCVAIVLLPIGMDAVFGEDECKLSDCNLPAPNYLSHKYKRIAYAPPATYVTSYYVHCTDGRELQITKDKYDSLYWLGENPT